MTFDKKPVKVTKKKVKTDIRGNPVATPRINPLAPKGKPGLPLATPRINPLGPKVVPGKLGVPPRVVPKPPAPTPPDIGLPGVLPHHAVAKSAQLPGAAIKPIAHPGKLKSRAPIDAVTPSDAELGADVVQDEVNPPFDPAEAYKVMSEWFASATYVGVPEGGLLPGEQLPELDDEEDD